MIFNEELTRCLSPYSYLPPQAVTNTTVSTPVIDMSLFARAQFNILAGTVGAAGVIAAQLQSSPLANFATIHNMTGAVVTNIAGASANNTIVTVEIRGDQVAYQNAGDRYVRLNITGSGNPLTVGCLGIGGCAMQGPASQQTNTSIVTQQVICST